MNKHRIFNTQKKRNGTNMFVKFKLKYKLLVVYFEFKWMTSKDSMLVKFCAKYSGNININWVHFFMFKKQKKHRNRLTSNECKNCKDIYALRK